MLQIASVPRRRLQCISSAHGRNEVDIRAFERTKSFTLAGVPAHHGDAEAPYVRLDTVALLVQVGVDPLGLRGHEEGKNISQEDSLLQTGWF